MSHRYYLLVLLFFSVITTSNANPCLSITDFATPNDGIDDSADIQTAIDNAKATGNKICFSPGKYLLSQTIIIPSGVHISGIGIGDNPIAPSHLTGTVLSFSGNNWAVKLTGSGARISNLIISSSNLNLTQSGLQILADNKLVESFSINNVLIHNFVNGTGFELRAQNGGGVVYGTMYDLRIRHAKIGVKFSRESNGDFVNSNKFIHGAISGGGFDYGVLSETGNNNVLDGTVIEPAATEYGHLVVQAGAEIIGNDIRIEGPSQNSATPLVDLQEGTKGTRLTGTGGGGVLRDLGDNSVRFFAVKSLDYQVAGYNQLDNSTFSGVNNNSIPNWEFVGGNPVVLQLEPEILPQHYVIEVTNGSVLKPAKVLKAFANSPLHSSANFGVYAKASSAGAVKITFHAKLTPGYITSMEHPGDGKWHFIGLSFDIDGSFSGSNDLHPEILLDGSSVLLTTPTFSYGRQGLPQLSAAPFSTTGGKLNGALQLASEAVDLTHYEEVETVKRLILPKTANVFIANFSELSSVNIHRINDLTYDHFPKGTIVTIVFETSVNINSSAYITLSDPFNGKGSLQLLSLGPTWQELSRSQ